jgi:glycosyltransferase involved in cell wall biosynthesis
MKVLHLNYRGLKGAGSAMATRRLHYGLRKAGVDSRILCVENGDESAHITALPRSRVRRRLDALFHKATAEFGLNYAFDLNSGMIKASPLYIDADIINAHNFTAFFSYLSLPGLSKLKPMVLTLHDMWSYTGHCYASLDCDRWKFGCGRCPHPEMFPSIRRDATRLEWRLKKWAYDRSNLNIITLSSERTEQARESLFKRFSINHIPNGIDVEAYKPIDREKCRSLLGLPNDKRVLMFMAKSLQSRIKGPDLVLRALQNLPPPIKAKTLLVLVGDNGDAITKSLDIETLYLGFIGNDRLKSICYSASDLFIYPTRADTFPLVLLESLSCGTPIVSFRTGGVPDVVRPGITGYLAEPENVEDLSRGILQLLENDVLRAHMREHCRRIAIHEYSIEVQVQRYMKVYREILDRRGLPISDPTPGSEAKCS